MKNSNVNTGVAFNFNEVLNSLLAKYETASQVKKAYSNLVNLYGKEDACRLMKAFKEAKANEVEVKANEVRSQLTVSDLMTFAFGKLDKGKKAGALAKLQTVFGKTDRATGWEDFLAKYYPHTMKGGKPAQAVWYTKDGKEVYKVYEPLTITTENAIKVLNRALDRLDKGAQRVYVSGKPRLTWSVEHTPKAIVEVNSSKIVKETLHNENGELLKDAYKVVRIEKVDLPDGLALTEEFITVKEFTKILNGTDEE